MNEPRDARETREAEATPPPASAENGSPPADTSSGASSNASSDTPQPAVDTNTPRHAAPDPEPTGHPRRWFLAGGAAALLAAAGGVGVALLRDRPKPKPSDPPARLTAAIAAERSLIADLDATTGGTPEVRRVLVQARADHVAHLNALHAIAAGYETAGTNTSTATASRSAGTPRTAAQLRAAEQSAATRAASDAAALDGRLAVLFASIAACEAGHAELLR